MDIKYKETIWGQFGAALDALENAINACPDELWSDHNKKPEFWYVAYHTLFWLDLYFSESPDKFVPPEPFGLEELDPAGVMPPQVYTRNELLSYLDHGRQKSLATIRSMTDLKMEQRFKFGNTDLDFGQMVLYQMRHVQHHAAQLNLILRQSIDSAPGWTFEAKDNLDNN